MKISVEKNEASMIFPKRVLRMVRNALVLLLFSLQALAGNLPGITHYDLDVRFALKDQRLKAVAIVTIRNSTDQSYSQLPFLLYRLFTVQRVTGQTGTALAFRQHVVELQDEPSFQVKELTVQLPSPLKPGDTYVMTLVFEGYMYGYPEVMAYVKDRVDENYSLLRPDALSYPVLAERTFASILHAAEVKFTYTISATVPKGYHVACGGAFVNARTMSDSVLFVYRSKIPTWRMDIAVAKFSHLESVPDHLTVYYVPKDSAGARGILEASKAAIKFYSELFGQPKGFQGYTIIEIPDGWGSQASDYYFLQTAAAFNDSARLGEVYHEIGHSWNATASGDVRRCRYFDEAFASFFEALTIRLIRGEKAFDDDMEKSRDLFVRWAQYDRQVFETPIAGYGVKELGRHSYTKGAWSLYVLHELVGEERFGLIIRTMLTEYSGKTIDFASFEKLCERVSGRNLQKFFAEWIYGTESSNLLVDKILIAEIVKRY